MRKLAIYNTYISRTKQVSRRRHGVTEGIAPVDRHVRCLLVPVYVSTHDVAGRLLTTLLASKHCRKLAGSKELAFVQALALRQQCAKQIEYGAISKRGGVKCRQRPATTTFCATCPSNAVSATMWTTDLSESPHDTGLVRFFLLIWPAKSHGHDSA